MKYWAVFILICVSILYTSSVYAQETNHFVTLINPVRISSYDPNPPASLEAEYKEVNKRGFSATWLLTYDVLANSDEIKVIKQMDGGQELGFFFEITPLFAKDAQVNYQKSDSWFRANSLLSTGYTQGDREKLIDTYFEKFKSVFGYYPKSVGAWWIDSYSLEYMREKYGILTNLDVADQYSRDGYQVWGQYWSAPYYPSRLHAGIPADSISNKLGVVTLQWAARDPLNGYGDGKASLYSTQDYFTVGLDNRYFDKLLNLYALNRDNGFGQMSVGLEADLSPEVYSGVYADQLDIVKKYQENNQLSVVTMNSFGSWYKDEYPNLSPTYIIQTNDLLGQNIKVIWYQSPFYRVGLTYNLNSRETKIFDLRGYPNNFQDPYFFDPNKDLNLSINIPSIIDGVNNSNEYWLVSKDLLKSTQGEGKGFKILFEDGNYLEFTPQEIITSGINIPKFVANSSFIRLSQDSTSKVLTPKIEWNTQPSGYIYKAFPPEKPLFLRMRRGIVLLALVILLLISLLIVIYKKIPYRYHLGFILILLTISLGGFGIWFVFFDNYYVSQSEVDTLSHLSLLPPGTVVVMDKECLNCFYLEKNKMAVFANKRGYVGDISKKSVVYDSNIFTTSSREEGRYELKRIKAKYIYLVNYGDYKEMLPFSPGDYNLELIYKNANSQLWEVK